MLLLKLLLNPGQAWGPYRRTLSFPCEGENDQGRLVPFLIWISLEPSYFVPSGEHLKKMVMRGELKKEGDYELFKTTKGHQILNLKNQDFYALVKGQQGDIIVHSDSDHKKSKSISQGNFFYVDFNDDPEFQDMPHLFMEDGSEFREFILPEGLPRKSDPQKKLVRTSKKVAREKVMEHIKGKGDKGSEKQYADKAEGLRARNKEELYEMARKQEVKGRSGMSKEELVRALEKKQK